MELRRLPDDALFLGPVPKRRELGRRWFVRSLEMRPVVHEHLSKCHSVGPGAIRIGAALEQEQRIRISEAVIESHLRAVKQQRITGRVRPILGDRGIDVRAAVEEQLKSRSRLILGSNPNTSS
jgi:hypothetical protein